MINFSVLPCDEMHTQDNNSPVCSNNAKKIQLFFVISPNNLYIIKDIEKTLWNSSATKSTDRWRLDLSFIFSTNQTVDVVFDGLSDLIDQCFFLSLEEKNPNAIDNSVGK